MSNHPQKPTINFSYQGQKIQNTTPQLNLQQTYTPPPPQVQICGGMQPKQYQMQSNCFPMQQQNIEQCCPIGLNMDMASSDVTLLNNKQEDANKKVVAVIVSFVNGFSYDSLFTTVQQKSQEGTKVQVYACGAASVTEILKGIKGEPVQNETIKQLVNQMKEVDPDCVVFNWECSSGYGEKQFTEGDTKVYQLIKWAVDNGHMTMFSDFSLKALINTWKPEILGPNPFVNIGETSDPFTLKFRAEDLRDCPSSQLQTVGQMAENGKCHVQSMSGTILYSVDSHAPKSKVYELQILTVVENNQIAHEHWKCRVGDLVGSAGHCLLTYKSGGHILTSMGHWIQLMKLDTSEKKLFEVAERQYGVQYAAKMKSEYAMMDQQSQKCYIRSNAVNIVQSQAPCSNMNTKTMSKKKG